MTHVNDSMVNINLQQSVTDQSSHVIHLTLFISFSVNMKVLIRDVVDLKLSPVFMKLLLILWVSAFAASEESYTLKDVSIKESDGKPVRIYTAKDLQKYDGSVCTLVKVFSINYI